MPLSVGQLLQNRYRIEALLGQGGFGAVYRAVDLNINFRVAIKENLDASPEAQRQFAREAALMVRLRHPSLPRVTDTFFIPGWGSYIVMDLIEGQTLQDMLKQYGPLDEARAVTWMSQVLDALAYLHSQTPSIIHRDVKPANIIITPNNQAMLVDFGIAKIYDPMLLTTTGARAVTPGYSPWEQYGQGGTDPRSDVYSAGATLYSLLTNKVPPEAVDLMGGVAKLAPPHNFNPRVSSRIEATILTAMNTQPTGRYSDAGQFKVALVSIPPPPAQRAPRVQAPSPAAPMPKQPIKRIRKYKIVVRIALMLLGASILVVAGAYINYALTNPFSFRFKNDVWNVRAVHPGGDGIDVSFDYYVDSAYAQSVEVSGWNLVNYERAIIRPTCNPLLSKIGYIHLEAGNGSVTCNYPNLYLAVNNKSTLDVEVAFCQISGSTDSCTPKSFQVPIH